jgi:photosystem II stability/assembly factor-like uncharacterized protein
LNISALVMKPGNSNTLYAGTGEAFLNGDALPGRGILKTTDGGLSWTRLHVANGLNTSFITEIAISPANPSVIYASGRRTYSANDLPAETTPDVGVNAIFKSTNEGQTWVDITTGKGIDHDPNFTFDNIPSDIAVSPLSPDTIFAGFGLHRSGGIWRSHNGGTTWTRLTTGLPDPTTANNGFQRIELGMSPSNPRLIYASISYLKKTGDTSSLNSGELLGVFKTTNGGNSWTKVGTALSTAPINVNGGRLTALGGQGWYDNVISVHPTNPNIVFLGGVDIYKSTDGGLNWQEITAWASGQGFPVVHADQHVFTFSTATEPPTLFVGNDGGIYRSTDLSASWAPMNRNLGVTQFYFFDAHPTLPLVLLGGTQDNGSPMLFNGGVNGWGDVTGGDGGQAQFDYQTSSTVYASIYNLNMLRYDGFNYSLGQPTSTTAIGVNGNNIINDTDVSRAGFFGPYEISPNNPNVLVLGTYRVLKTTDQGDTWTDITNKPNGLYNNKSIATVAVAPGNDNIIWAATDSARIFKTENNGGLWTDVTTPNLPDRFLTDIEFHPANPAAVYTTFSGYGTPHVFKTTNAGGAWTNITGNLPNIPVNCIQGHPTKPAVLFIGTDIGVFLTEDDGATWQPANTGFPATQVVSLVLNTRTDRIVAATHGRGVFDAVLSTATSVTETAELPRSPALHQNYPNPFNPSTTIFYELPEPATVTLKVFDVLGREVTTILSEVKQTAGAKRETFNAASLASGVYFARLSVNGRIVGDKKMMLVR